MPWNEPRSLTDHEVYALTAYILAEGKVIDAKLVLNARSLPKVEMPNRNGFLPRFPELIRISVAVFKFASHVLALRRASKPNELESKIV